MTKSDKSGRTVLISGGAGGMGTAIAAAFAASGDRVALTDLGGSALDQALAALHERGATATALPADLRHVAACTAVAEQAAAWGGGLDVVINAAGVWREGPSEEVTEDDWDLVLDVNLKGAFFLTRAAIPKLGNGSAIINIASDAGLVGNAGAAVYCASKGGLVLLTKALALELAPRGIRVNAVCPGDVATPMIEFQANRYGGDDPEAYKRALLGHYPQGERARFIQAAEIARFVHYLCEPAAAPITGAALPIDFGVTAGY